MEPGKPRHGAHQRWSRAVVRTRRAGMSARRVAARASSGLGAVVTPAKRKRQPACRQTHTRSCALSAVPAPGAGRFGRSAIDGSRPGAFFAWVCGLALAIPLAGCATNRVPRTAPDVLAPQLAAIVSCLQRGYPARRCASARGGRLDAAGRIEVDAFYRCGVNFPSAAARRVGFSVTLTVHAPPYCVVEGWIAPQQIEKLYKIPGVSGVSLPRYGHSGRASQR